MNYRLSLLGSFALAVEGKPLRFPSRKESSLYAYLTLHQENGGIRRERLAGLLWPEMEEQRARRNLSTALWRIKATLSKIEAASLAPQASGEAVGIELRPEAVDALKFQLLLETAERQPEADRLPMLREAEALYGGDLLDDFEDEWCEETRRYLRAQYVNALRQLSSIHKNHGDYATAVQFARKLVAVEPLDEEGHKELMLLHHLAGERHAALTQYETLRKNLRLELGIEPNEATTQLWEYVRTSISDSDVSIRLTPQSYASTGSRVPLIGREPYVSTILERIQESVQGRGSAVLISGEAGIGKTKLVETLATEARLRNVQVFQGRCPDLQNPPPYQVILQALWPRVMEATRGEDPGSPLSAILRALSFEGPLTKRASRSVEPTLNTTIVMEAILGLIGSHSAKKPTLLIFEDIHRIDQASLTLLATLLDRVSSISVAVLATIRSEEKKSSEVVSTLTANGALHIALPPLSESELHRLIKAILRDKSVSQEVLNFVWNRTDGVPLFALELVDFMVAGGHIYRTDSAIWKLRDQTSEIPDRFPSRVNEVIRKRVDSLDRQSRQTLINAAILGMEFGLKQLVALTGFPEDTIGDCLNKLVDNRLAVEFEERFRFRHETIRAVALDLPTDTMRRLLHLRAGEVFEKSGFSQPEDLYLHFLEADRYDKALFYAEASGDKARSVHANMNAAAWYTKAIELLDRTSLLSKDKLRKKVQLLIKRHEILELLGDPNRLDHIDSIHELAVGLEDKGLLAQIQSLRARIIARSKAPQDGLGAADTACRLYREIGDLRGEAAATETLGEIFLYLRNLDRAAEKFNRAIQLFRQAGDQTGEARALVANSTLLTVVDVQKAITFLEKAGSLLKNSNDFRTSARFHFQRGICYRILGQAKMSENSLRAGLELTLRTGDRTYEARARSQLSATLSALGRHAEAIKEARRSIRLARQTNDNRALITGLNNAAYSAYRLSGALKHAKTAAMMALHLKESASQLETAMYKDTLAAILLELRDVDSALEVAIQARTLCSRGRPTFVKGDIYHHLGTIYHARKEYDKAILYLQRAIRIFRRSNDLSPQLLTTASLILSLVELGEIRLACRYANRISRVMREVDGIEQVQAILWSQYRAFLAAGRLPEARRALNRAYDAVLSQAGSLKGRNRHRFLSNLWINRTIIAEAAHVGSDKGRQISSTIDSSAATTLRSN